MWSGGGGSFQIYMDNVAKIKCHKVSHAVRQNNSTKGRNFRHGKGWLLHDVSNFDAWHMQVKQTYKWSNMRMKKVPSPIVADSYVFPLEKQAHFFCSRKHKISPIISKQMVQKHNISFYSSRNQTIMPFFLGGGGDVSQPSKQLMSSKRQKSKCRNMTTLTTVASAHIRQPSPSPIWGI